MASSTQQHCRSFRRRQAFPLAVPTLCPSCSRITLADLGEFLWLLPPVGTPTRSAINAVFAKAMLASPVATVEASSTKIVHLTLRVNPHMLSIVPSDVGHDIQRLGGVRRLSFPVPLDMPPVGLTTAARHRDTPVVRNLRSTVREILRHRREGLRARGARRLISASRLRFRSVSLASGVTTEDGPGDARTICRDLADTRLRLAIRVTPAVVAPSQRRWQPA
jgi:hypothetical protein